MTSNPIKKPPLYQASKWIQLQALLDNKEMERLMEDMGKVSLYFVGTVCIPGEEVLAKEKFLEKYGDYVSELKSGKIPDGSLYRPFFSCSLSLRDDHFIAVDAREEKRVISIVKPVVQMQLHMLGYSSMEQKFRPMILGKNSIHWGIQLSYPQLFLDPETKKIENVLTNGSFPNSSLFRTIQTWFRKNTMPTPFVVDGKRINVPMRLGRDCFRWINSHPQLRELGIQVAEIVGGKIES